MPQVPGRVESILEATINGTTYTIPPHSRIEELLLELKGVIEGGSGGSDYNNIANKPQINSVTLVGNKTLSDLGIVNPMLMKGRVATVSALPQNAEVGWVYLVGLSDDADLREYVYTADGEWEFIGYNTLVIDSALSTTSENPVQNKVVTSAINGKLSPSDVDSSLSASSENPVQNKVVKAALDLKLSTSSIDSTFSSSSTNPIQNAALFAAMTPLTSAQYEALTTKTNPLYYVYEEES